MAPVWHLFGVWVWVEHTGHFGTSMRNAKAANSHPARDLHGEFGSEVSRWPSLAQDLFCCLVKDSRRRRAFSRKECEVKGLTSSFSAEKLEVKPLTSSCRAGKPERRGLRCSFSRKECEVEGVDLLFCGKKLEVQSWRAAFSRKDCAVKVADLLFPAGKTRGQGA